MDDVWDASMEAALRAAEAGAAARRATAPAAPAPPPPPRPAALATGVFASDSAPAPPRPAPRLAPVFAAAAGAAAAPPRPPPAAVSNGPRPGFAGAGPHHGAPPGTYAPPRPPAGHPTWPPPHPTSHPFRPAAVCVAPPAPGPAAHAAIRIGPDGAIDVALNGDAGARAALASVGATWTPADRVWRLPLARLPDAQAALAGLGRVAVDPAPDVALRILRTAAAAPDDSDRYASIPPRLEAALMPFQREGVKFALARGGRALIGDEMGLGKTVQALAVAAAYRAEWPALIVAPSSLREAWADALAEWLGVRGARVLVINAAKDGDAVGLGPAPPFDFVVASYNLVPKLRDRLEAAAFRVVILDESHYIKDPKSQRTKDTVPIAQRATRCLLLSGTPALARPKELLQQLAALLPAARLRIKDFGDRYCRAPPSRFGGVYDGATNLDELHRVLTAAVMVRRLKAGVLSQLPPKRRQQVFLSLEPAEKSQLAKLTAGLDAARRAMASAAAVAAAGGDPAALRGEERRAVMDAYHQTALLKCKAVQRYVQDLLDAGDKFLIFAHHVELLDAITAVLNRARVKFIRIDGSVAASKRQGLVTDFQSTADVRAAVLSITAAGTGLTLTGASVVVFAELSWTPGQVVQAEDRAHRIGQCRAVNVYYLHVRGSADDVVWSTLASKLDAVGHAVDGRGDALRLAAPARVAAPPGQATLEGSLAAAAARRAAGEGASASAPPPPAAPQLYAEDDGFSSPVRSPDENERPDKRSRWE